MYFNPYRAQAYMEERVKDALRKAEEARPIREARGSRKMWGWRRLVVLSPESLLAIFTDGRADEPHRQSPSAAPSPT